MIGRVFLPILHRSELTVLVMLGKKAILKASSAGVIFNFPSFQLLQCEPSRRCVRAQCDKKWAVESSPGTIPRDHPQISPLDIIPRFHPNSLEEWSDGESSTGLDVQHVQGRNILRSLLVKGTWWVSMATLEHLPELWALGDSPAHRASSHIPVLGASGLSWPHQSFPHCSQIPELGAPHGAQAAVVGSVSSLAS